MRCPWCGRLEDKVADSREAQGEFMSELEGLVKKRSAR
jgi:transcriptional regulator NrdR family protein